MRRPEVTARPTAPPTEPLTDVPSASATAERSGRRRTRRQSHRALGQRREAQVELRPDRVERRPHAGRVLRPMRLPTHRATTANLQALYPFIVETGLGSEGVYVGRETGSGASFVYDPWHFYQQQYVTNANILLAGVLGRGKSALAKTLAHRLAAFGVRSYVPADPKGEWGAVSRSLGLEPLTLGRGMTTRINPLDPGPRPTHLNDVSWISEVRTRRIALLQALAETGLNRPLHAVERNALYLALDRVTRPEADLGRQPVPLLPDIVEALLRPTDAMATTIGMPNAAALAEASRDATLELRRLVVGDLAGLFDGPTTHPLDFDVPIQVVDTSRLSGDDTAVALVMSCASAWMEAAISDPTSGRRLVVYDEAWRMMRVPALVRRMQAHWKLSRSWGIANFAVVHRLSDLGSVGDAGSEAVALARGLLADCSTRIVYAQETDQIPATASSLGLTDVEASLLPGLPVGRGLWKVGRRSFVVDHVLGGDEQSFIDTDSRMR